MFLNSAPWVVLGLIWFCHVGLGVGALSSNITEFFHRLDGGRGWLRRELLRRAAECYAQAGSWSDSAECWLDLGDHQRAAAAYEQAGAIGRAASVLRAGGHYEAAFRLYADWESRLGADDVLGRLQSLLGQSSCHLLGARPGQRSGPLSVSAGRESWQRARRLLLSDAVTSGSLRIACWSALGDYGSVVGRYDLLQEGYERALSELDADSDANRSRMIVLLRSYRDHVRGYGDRLLIVSLETRLAELGEGAPETGVGDGPVPPSRIVNSIGMELALMPAGEFLMGSPETEEGRFDGEGPQHLVRITQAFYLGVYPVTQLEYERVMGNNPSAFCSTGRYSSRVSGQDTSRFPVEQVSWEEAMEFCRRLSAQEGVEYFLPTEAQWEYACRAGSVGRWSFGEEEERLSEYAWYGEDFLRGTPHTVGAKQPNAWGLHDIHGNVLEWCSDWYGPYAASAVDDPMGPEAGSYRVIRGGGWDYDAGLCRSAYRYGDAPSARSDALGFRLAFSSVDQSGRQSSQAAVQRKSSEAIHGG